MENYIHKENLALFKKRLGEPHTEAQHDTLLSKRQGDRTWRG
jgi:hypothetical protein